MKRLVRLALTTSLILAVVFSLSYRQAALATPFSDVPANHWAYQYIQSLAADGLIEGYPNGQFYGNRPLTRYEMAVMVARVIAKLQDNPDLATKEDLAELQQLTDALKDELDALGVRVTNLESSLDALNKKTAFAQALWMHANMLGGDSMRQFAHQAASVSAAGQKASSADAVTGDYLYSDPKDEWWDNYGSGDKIDREDGIFTLGYNVSPNLTVSFPVHVENWGFVGQEGGDNGISFDPAIDVNVKQAGAISNLNIHFGQLTNYTSSRTGLTFQKPIGNQFPLYDEPLQPPPNGLSIGGTLDGLTDFSFAFARLVPTLLANETVLIDQSGDNSLYGELNPFQPSQTGFLLSSPTGAGTANTATTANKTDFFGPTQTPLSTVFLTGDPLGGTLYVSSYDGVSYNPNGTCAVAGCSPAAPPAWQYDGSTNQVVFAAPLPVGTTIKFTYTSQAASATTLVQRYMITGRLNQRIKGLPGAEIGLTFNRIFDFADYEINNGFSATAAVGPSPAGATQPLSYGEGMVSDTVFGVDAQVPIPLDISGKGSLPTLFGEVADSKYTNDYYHTPADSDAAAVAGLKLKFHKVSASVQYQTVGMNYIDGADIQYEGNAPAILANWHSPYIPDFMGFSNTLGLNQQFSGQAGVTAGSAASPGKLLTNSVYTYDYPAYNPFHGYGPYYYQAFAPNTRGITVAINTPIQFGGAKGTTVNGGLQVQHLTEITPNSFMAQVFGCPEGSTASGCAFASSTLMTDDNLTGTAAFVVPVFGEKVSLNLSGVAERLQRLDTTAQPYYPFALDENIGQVDVASPGAPPNNENAAGGELVGSPAVNTVRFLPNYVNVTHYTYAVSASLPVTTALTFNTNYNLQRYTGSYASPVYGTTPGQNMEQAKIYVDGGLTYAIPKTNSSISFVARNYKYTDALLPSYNYSLNKEDFTYTVRF